MGLRKGAIIYRARGLAAVSFTMRRGLIVRTFDLLQRGIAAARPTRGGFEIVPIGLKLWMLRAFMRCLAALPWSWLHAFGHLLGHLLWRFDTREKHITQTNIALCLPELSAEQQAQLVRASLIDFGRTAFEMPKLWLAPLTTALSAITEIEGEDILKRKLALGHGTIVLGPHHGNWEVAGLYLGQEYGITMMYLPAQSAAANELVRIGRGRTGATLVPADINGVRTVLKVLRRGGAVGILPDQVPKQAGAELAPFFGQPALTMTLVSNLLQKTNARAIIVAALRTPDGFKLVFREPDQAIYSPDLMQSLIGLNRSVEACVREHPEQYQWEYKRFKGPARSKSSVYK
jgi:Kdo2-lipid IVA lauroyltransferase/acyltransferase